MPNKYITIVDRDPVWINDTIKSKIKTKNLLLKQYMQNDRSSHQRCSMKKGVLRNFTEFTRKHLRQSLFFKKFAGLRPSTLLKKKLWYRCFSVNFVKFLRTPFFCRTTPVAASEFHSVAEFVEFPFSNFAGFLATILPKIFFSKILCKLKPLFPVNQILRSTCVKKKFSF